MFEESKFVFQIVNTICAGEVEEDERGKNKKEYFEERMHILIT